MGSSVWRMFFWMSSSGPGRWLSWSLSWSASLAFFSIRCRSARLGSTWPTSSRICCRTSSSLPGLCWIFAFNRSPVFARSSCFRCSWNAGGVFNAARKNIHVSHVILHSFVRARIILSATSRWNVAVKTLNSFGRNRNGAVIAFPFVILDRNFRSFKLFSWKKKEEERNVWIS